ncbi:DEAD/DEAH box helicase [Methylobacterium indicum]|uniref:Helicase n=1 Tax=Methylobacterium indicum TaxID=1775910 RepID=A0A8H8X0K5_9HYPH|nr:DEAD/DEAH box helicase [Methylobacterium indicum]BCM87839.1 helicase [Methylobacterium indicum]
MAPKILRPHQNRSIEMLRDSLRSGRRRPLLNLPTGAGKTVVASALAQNVLARGNSVTFCVPAIALIDQTVDRFAEDGITDVGVIQADHPMRNPFAPVQIASVQTLRVRYKDPDLVPRSNLVIVDEAHNHFDYMSSWMGSEGWRRIPFIGLSATPGTKGLGRHYDDLILPITMQELIDQGMLSEFRVFVPSRADLSNVPIVAGDYDENALAEAMSQPHITADVVENWLKHGEGRPTLCFCVNRKHAAELQAHFQKAGVSAGYVDAYTSKEDRRLLQQGFADGSIEVVCNVDVLTTGVDWDVRCLILARPTKSWMRYVQIIGRALRIAGPETRLGRKDYALIFDHSDTTETLGLVTDIHFNQLDDGTRAKKDAKKPGEVKPERLPKECPSCKMMKPPATPVCPHCGFKPTPRSDIVCAEGELVELTGEKAKKLEATREEKQRWYSGILHIQRQQNRNPGWVAHTYKEKFGVWPRGMADHPVEPTPDILAFIKHRQIKRAKGRQHERAA